MKVFQDEFETLKESFILGTHFTNNQLLVLTTEPGKDAYLLPQKFETEDKAIEYYKAHLKEEVV